MNYVMEVGPLPDGEWLVFSVDDSDEKLVELVVGIDRDQTRNELASLIAGIPAQCCSTLREFGAAHGWIPGPPHTLAREIAAWAAVCVENFQALAGIQPDPRLIAAWLRACSTLLAAQPWEQLKSRRRRILDVHFDGGMRGRKSLYLYGDEKKYRLLLGDSIDALLDEGGPLGLPSNCLTQIIYVEPGPTPSAIADVYERSFVPRVLRFERGALTPLKETELVMLTGIVGALASLCMHRGYGKSEAFGVETLVLPHSFERGEEKRRLAS